MLNAIIDTVMPPRSISGRYAKIHGQPLPLNPQTFTQKLFHRMLEWDVNPPPAAQVWTDKLHAKERAGSVLGPGHTAKLYWKGAEPRDIPFGELPLPHVIKARHGSRMNLVAREDLDQMDVIHQCSAWMQRNYYDHAREGQYRRLTKGLIIEECLQNSDGSPVLDYKFWCFHGRPIMVHVDNPDQSINPFYDMGWDLLDLHYRKDCPRPRLDRPANFDAMREMAAQLALCWDFVRVDLFSVNDRPYFSEMTFTPNAGGMHFLPEHWDTTLGNYW